LRTHLRGRVEGSSRDVAVFDVSTAGDRRGKVKGGNCYLSLGKASLAHFALLGSERSGIASTSRGRAEVGLILRRLTTFITYIIFYYNIVSRSTL